MIKICHQPREESRKKSLSAASSIYHREDKQIVHILKNKCCFEHNSTASMDALYLRPVLKENKECLLQKHSFH